MSAAPRPGPVTRWMRWALLVHHVVWPVLLGGTLFASGGLDAVVFWLLAIFVLAAPLTVLLASLHALALVRYRDAVRRDPRLELGTARLVRNCALIAAAAAAPLIGTIALLRLSGLAWANERWTPAFWVSLGTPVVVGFVNLLVPRLLVPSLRRGLFVAEV